MSFHRVVLIALVLHAGNACSQGVKDAATKTKVRGLTYRLKVEFKHEKPGDGAPTLHFHHGFHNHTTRDIYLSFQGDPLYFRSIQPDSLFKIIKGKTHPMTYSGMPGPPGPEQILKVPAHRSASHRTWRWLDALSLNYDDPKRWAQYIFKKPGRVKVRACYGTWAIHVEMHKELLPKGTRLWQGEVCAPPVTFAVPRLSRDAQAL